MPDTADHRTAMHAAAVRRRTRGVAAWEYAIPEFGTILRDNEPSSVDGGTLTAVRDALVAILQASSWYRVSASDEHSELYEIVDELSNVADPDIFSAIEDPDYDPEHHFDAILGRLYDLADHERCWLAP